MPKVSQEHRDARRAQILRAAAACFERKGYQRTTMADIIRESGLSAGAIYVYFTGKQDIVRAVAEESLSIRAETIIAQADDGALGPAALVAAAVDSAAMPSFAPELWSLASRDAEVRELLVGFLGDARAMAETAVRAWAERHPEVPAAHGLGPAEWARGVGPAIVGLLAGQSLLALVDSDRDYPEAVRLLLERPRGD